MSSDILQMESVQVVKEEPDVKVELVNDDHEVKTYQADEAVFDVVKVEENHGGGGTICAKKFIIEALWRS